MTALGPDSFYSAKVRIARAGEHLKDLIAQIDSFFSKKPYARIVEPDPDGIHEIHKIRITERFPFRWRILTTEIIEHARASLDHAVWASAFLHTKNPNLAFGYFPFAKDAAHFDNRLKGLTKDAPPEIQTLLRSFQPYPGGNEEILFHLNDMCNLSKHAMIALIGGATGSGEIQGTGWNGPVQFYDPLFLDREKNEIPYARVQRGFQFEHNFELTVYPALDHREASSAEPATTVLDAMLSEAYRVVIAIENECRRIGLIE